MLTHEMQRFILDNPMDADNCEDLCNWTCDEFNLSDNEVDDVWDFIRVNTNLPK